jgi:hypothetical protein
LAGGTETAHSSRASNSALIFKSQTITNSAMKDGMAHINDTVKFKDAKGQEVKHSHLFEKQ